MAKVLVVGLNPAWQKVLKFPDFKIDEINRAQAMLSFASGKGVNVAKVLTRLGHQVWLLQILGGENGKRINRECEALGIHCINIWTDNETRVCTTLLDKKNGKVTEIIEPFNIAVNEEPNSAVSNELILAALNLLLPSELMGVSQKKVGSGMLDIHGFDGMAISGSVPKNVDAGVANEILKRVRAKVCIVDAWQGFELEDLAETACVKINSTEFKSLEKLFGSESVANSKICFAITEGASPAFIDRTGAPRIKFTLPKCTGIVNTIGAGDTVTAGLLHFLMKGEALENAFQGALAMGSASCLSAFPGDFLEIDSQKILSEMVKENV